ncbi:MAG: NAD(P)-dependent oxidoreductase [Candidatus Thermoplasmatota archaeon]|jgi:nucleoside-diphosphate-sugar epimerase|nr:NAD(P)-dependent oxidoreductase [Candidatus Thermoplasmatota archaeon]
MNILITGGTGFIGTHLIQELKKYDHTINVLTRNPSHHIPEVHPIKGDITEPQILSKALSDIDAVFHNAALAIDSGRKKEIKNVNIIGTRNLAEACVTNNVSRIIYTSSAGVYGFPNSKEPLIETSPKHPMNTYQLSKLEGEKVLQSYKELKTSIIRPPLVLGKGGMGSKVVVENLKQHRMPYIGSGTNHIPIVHPSDVSQCLRLALEKDTKGDIFNVVSFTCTIQELFKEITKKLSIPEPTKHVPYHLAYLNAVFSELFSPNPRLTRFRLKTLATTRIINCDKAKKDLGFQPRYTLEKTVDDIIRS